jgi:UDP-N-acetylmuramate dehydrogenase
MNAGAFGGETWRHVLSVETIDRKGNRRKRNAEEYQVGYRSVSGPADEWFTAAIFQFEQGDGSAASEAIRQLLARRAETQPTGAASCGSVFTNPENDHAARLIESCGLKGYRIGGAVVSQKHANFIINDNNASADDIESLIKHVQRTVRDQQGVELKTEVRIVGGAA